MNDVSPKSSTSPSIRDGCSWTPDGVRRRPVDDGDTAVRCPFASLRLLGSWVQRCVDTAGPVPSRPSFDATATGHGSLGRVRDEDSVRVLVDEPDLFFAEFVDAILRDAGPEFLVREMPSLRGALDHLYEAKDGELIITNLTVADDAAPLEPARLRRAAPEVAIVVLSATTDPEPVGERLRLGADRVQERTDAGLVPGGDPGRRPLVLVGGRRPWRGDRRGPVDPADPDRRPRGTRGWWTPTACRRRLNIPHPAATMAEP